MTSDLKHCPFCGKDVQADVDSREVLHQNGIFWVDDKDSGRIYLGKSDMEAGTHFDGLCWEVHCPTIYGGCGAEISGDSRQEAIDAWNKRAQAEVETSPADFKEGQWWVAELDAIQSTPFGEAVVVTLDMRRAVAVVHNLLRTVSEHTPTEVVWPDHRGRVNNLDFDDDDVTWRGGMAPVAGTKLYTEQQVRKMLAQKGQA